MTVDGRHRTKHRENHGKGPHSVHYGRVVQDRERVSCGSAGQHADSAQTDWNCNQQKQHCQSALFCSVEQSNRPENKSQNHCQPIAFGPGPDRSRVLCGSSAAVGNGSRCRRGVGRSRRRRNVVWLRRGRNIGWSRIRSDRVRIGLRSMGTPRKVSHKTSITRSARAAVRASIHRFFFWFEFQLSARVSHPCALASRKDGDFAFSFVFSGGVRVPLFVLSIFCFQISNFYFSFFFVAFAFSVFAYA